MSGFDRERGRQELLNFALGAELDVVLDALEECVEPDGWPAIMRILGTYYPESIFPQRSVEADWGNGPQVVSLLRLLNTAEAKLDRIAELHVRVDDPIDWTDEIVYGCLTCGEGWPCDTAKILGGRLREYGSSGPAPAPPPATTPRKDPHEPGHPVA